MAAVLRRLGCVAMAWLPTPMLLAWALWRRRLGCYDHQTLGLFTQAWRRSGGVQALCRLALFRRDLGRPLPRRWAARLRAGLPELPRALRRRAIGLLAEAAPSALHGLDAAMLADAAAGQPGVAACTAGGDDELACLQGSQAALRQAFAHWLLDRAAHEGLCVVGNAAGLADRGLGAAIDRRAAVIRFNRWQGPEVFEVDVGARFDVWMVSPDMDLPVPAGLSWAIVSGPDPRFTLRRWPTAVRLAAAGVPVLTVPLVVWRHLVSQLHVSVAGIGWGRDGKGRHHLVASSQSGGSRHRWAAEAHQLALWRQEGLGDLGDEAGGG